MSKEINKDRKNQKKRRVQVTVLDTNKSEYDFPVQILEDNEQNEQIDEPNNANDEEGSDTLPKDSVLPDGLPEMPIGMEMNEPNENTSDNAVDFSNSALNVSRETSTCSQYFNTYVNNGINVIDPSTYSPMVYVVDNQKMVYSNGYPFIYDVNNQPQKKSSLPYAYVSRNSFDKPDFNISQNKLKLYNYWIETSNIKQTELQIIQMFGAENIFNTKSLFFRKKNSYMGEKIILISKIPQKPYKFINRINRTFSKERRTIKSVLGDYIISPDCLFIILAERSIEYICNNYYRYHKNERTRIETLINSFKSKFTCITESDIN